MKSWSVLVIYDTMHEILFLCDDTVWRFRTDAKSAFNITIMITSKTSLYAVQSLDKNVIPESNI